MYLKSFFVLYVKLSQHENSVDFQRKMKDIKKGKDIYIDLTFSICLTWCCQDVLLQVSVNEIEVPHIA